MRPGGALLAGHVALAALAVVPLLGIEAPARSSVVAVGGDLARRIATREFPSVFQAWNPADNLPGADALAALARHDLVWHAPSFFGLIWDRQPEGLAERFTPESVANARARRKLLLRRNSNMVLLAEIRYRDAHRSFLPEGHAWWLRDGSGRIVPGWEEGGYLRLDVGSPAFRRHVAAQCRAAVASGVVDGVLLDWWEDDDDRLALVREVRTAIGPSALIVANANDRQTPRTAPYLNGYFMECYRTRTAEEWRRIEETLAWAEQNLRPPRVNCVEFWYHRSRDDLHLMRAVTTLVLTRSDGYCLFSDPNDLPTPDHHHNWYPFWEKRLGRPRAPGRKRPDGAWMRPFTRGVALYNPLGNPAVTVAFTAPHTSLARGERSWRHRLDAADGDLYLADRPSASPHSGRETRGGR
jgi:hypothetical protein